MHLVRPDAFFDRLGATGTIGFGEAYMAGDWTADDLAGVLSAFAANMRDLVPEMLHRLRHAVLSRRRRPRQHDRRRAREHPSPLRPVQRPVQDLPRRVDDLLVRRSSTASPTAPTRSSPTPSAARSTGCSTPRPSAPAPGCSRSARAGANSPSAPPGAARSHVADHLDRAGRAGSRPHRRRRADRPRRGAAAGLPRGRRAATTPSSASR